MSESNHITLRAALTADCNALFRQLTRWLGPPELACDVLQATTSSMDRVSDFALARSPKDFMYRVAVNVVPERRRVERRYLSAAEVDSLLDVPDESPTPANATEARSELAALDRALAELSPRQREVFGAAMQRKMPDRKIAALLGISERMVESDLKHALLHCASRLGRKSTGRSGGSPSRS